MNDIVKLPEELTRAEICDICMSYRHDFFFNKPEPGDHDEWFFKLQSGMTDKEREMLIWKVGEFYRLIKRTLIENHKHEN